MTVYFYVIHVFSYIALGIGVLVLLRTAPADLWLKSLIGATFAVFLIHLSAAFQNDLFGFDFRIFRNAGCDVWAGIDPYAPARFAEHPFLNPLTSLPLFAAFAVLPFRISLAVWTILNIVAGLALPALSWFVMRSQDHIDRASGHFESMPCGIPLQTVAGLAICVIFSEASLKGFLLGQLSVFTAAMVLMALLCQGRDRPIWAGVCLSLATVKIATMLPFLLLFLRRADRWTWPTLAALVIGTCLMTGKPGELPGRLAILTDRIANLSAPGHVNDYSYEGTRNESIISFEHLFYRLGMRDRESIRHSQLLALLAVGAWVAWLVLANPFPRTDAVCLICLFSMLFLYHRDYDTVILALPLVHCAGKVRVTTGQARRLYAACGLIVIAVLYLNAGHLRTLTQWSLAWGPWGRLVQAAILPCVAWLILLAMTLLAWATRLRAHGDDATDRLAMQPSSESPLSSIVYRQPTRL
jgi:Glycosyltransferase family 87